MQVSLINGSIHFYVSSNKRESLERNILSPCSLQNSTVLIWAQHFIFSHTFSHRGFKSTQKRANLFTYCYCTIIYFVATLGRCFLLSWWQFSFNLWWRCKCPFNSFLSHQIWERGLRKEATTFTKYYYDLRLPTDKQECDKKCLGCQRMPLNGHTLVLIWTWKKFWWLA